MTYAQKRNLFLAKFDFLKPYGFFVKNKKLFYVDFPGKIFIVISLENFHGITDVELDIYPFCWDITAEMMKEINGNLAVTNILYRKIGLCLF